MRALFEDLGAVVVDGGPTLNPATNDLVRAIEACPAAEVVVLPNSPNVILAAREAAEVADKPVEVVDSDSQQAGITGLVEFDPDVDAATNAGRLADALAAVRTAAVAQAARDDDEGRFVRGDAVGFAGDRIVAWGDTSSTLAATVAEIVDGAEIVTVIEGEDAPIPLDELPLELPDGAELELHRGGQPSYWWLIAAQ
jgi:hypothetical protein